MCLCWRCLCVCCEWVRVRGDKHTKANTCIESYSGLLVVIHSKECTADRSDGTGRHLGESATCVQLPGWRERGWPVRHSSHSRRTL